MSNNPRLPMHEEILLLALDDEKGTTPTGSMFANAMGGAMLAELVMNKVLSVSSEKDRKVRVLNPLPTGDVLLDEALAMVRDQNKDKKATHWVTKFAGIKDLKKRTAACLVEKGILSEGEDKVLGLFKRTIYPEVDSGPEADLRRRMREAIFTDTLDPDPKTIVVVALTDASQMLPTLFDKKELKGRKERIKRLTSGEVVGQATKEAVEAIQAAIIMTAVIVPVIVTSS
jgi:golgi phosphoprotein 3